VPKAVMAQLFNEASISASTRFFKFKPSTDRVFYIAPAAMVFIVGTVIFLYAQLA
jgi:hypothetical protein